MALRGQKISEGYHVLEYIQLQYQPEWSPIVYFWEASEKWSQHGASIIPSGPNLEVTLACILHLGMEGIHPK